MGKHRKFAFALLGAFFLATQLAVEPAQAMMFQDVRGPLFKDADQALQMAKKSRADILSPKNFSEGMKRYQQADADFQRGRNLDDIQRRLKEASAYFQKAQEATKLAEVTFASHLKTRSDALDAGAPKFAETFWTQAESKFAEAARKLEDGDVNDARKKADEADVIFRQAELAAIKVNLLNETWELLRRAEAEKVKDRAPKTLERARTLITQAEKELNTNRYDNDVARNLAEQAKYEAKHALYLSELIRKMKDSKQSTEDLLLASERPLMRIASEIDIVAEFDQGFGKVTEQIINYIRTYKDSTDRLSREITERDQRIHNQELRMAEMEKQLGGIAQEKTALARQIEAQARIREQFAKVEGMFSREEARVYREGDNVIIRLVALTFPSGKSTIEAANFGLLTRLQGAIRVFPSAKVLVEGHTDSFGSDEANLRLSQARAESVKQYLMANMNINDNDVTAIGYGESRPIANNKTEEGRTRNRRIEVIIQPQISGTN